MANNFSDFKQWCENNNRQDLLDRWDYELNGCGPEDIGKASRANRYFKCPRGLHKSELFDINYITTTKPNYEAGCRACNSFAQFIIDNYGEEHLNTIWSAENERLPEDIMINMNRKKTFIFNCPDNKDHSFSHPLGKYIKDSQCPHCKKYNRSIAGRFPIVNILWSDLNDDQPEDYVASDYMVKYWKCDKGIHDDYSRGIRESIRHNFKCKICENEENGLLPGGIKNMTGMKFGELTVKCFYGSEDNHALWNCSCSCGADDVIVVGAQLRSGSRTTCGNRSIHKMGENNMNWKGGYYGNSSDKRRTKEYSEWKNAVYEKDKNRCVICGSTENIEAHHIYQFANYEDLRLDVSNGMSLCKIHHNIAVKGSYHSVYGTNNFLPEQLDDYINEKRRELGIDKPFDIYEYMFNYASPYHCITDFSPTPESIPYPEELPAELDEVFIDEITEPKAS